MSESGPRSSGGLAPGHFDNHGIGGLVRRVLFRGQPPSQITDGRRTIGRMVDSLQEPRAIAFQREGGDLQFLAGRIVVELHPATARLGHRHGSHRLLVASHAARLAKELRARSLQQGDALSRGRLQLLRRRRISSLERESEYQVHAITNKGASHNSGFLSSVHSFAPASSSNLTAGVRPCLRARLNAVSPLAPFAFKSAPLANNRPTVSVPAASEYAAPIR